MDKEEIARRHAAFLQQMEEFALLDMSGLQEVMDFLEAQRRHYMKILISAAAEEPPHEKSPNRKHQIRMDTDLAFQDQHLHIKHNLVAEHFTHRLMDMGVFATDIVILYNYDKERSWYTMYYNTLP